jgi:hypothetical protein
VKFSPTYTKIALVAWGTKEKEKFFYYLTQNLSFWQTFFLLLWSFFACCHKGCNFFQTLIGGLLKESLKQIDFEALILETKDLVFFPKIKYLSPPSQTLKIVPYTPNPKPSKQCHSHEKPKEYPKHLFLPLTNAFMIEHIFPKLPLDPSMMWQLH